ncbi:MAG TPA: hypothetical protein PK961_06325 [bacterium]|nr:hypothetical protein [bacterium]
MRAFGAIFLSRDADLHTVHLWQKLAGKDGSSLTTILCVGDSFTYGGRVDPQQTYPVLLSNKLNDPAAGRNYLVVNKGICESNSRIHAKKLPAWLDEYRPDMVIVLSGSANRFHPVLFRDIEEGNAQKIIRYLITEVRVAKLFRILYLTAKSKLLFIDMDDENRIKQFQKQNKFDLVVEYALRGIKNNPYNIDLLYHMTKAFDLQSRYSSEEIFRELDQIRQERPFLNKQADFMGYLDLYRDKQRYEASVTDWLRGDLETIVTLCREKGTTLILQNYPVNYPLANDVLREIAEKHSLPFVDNLAVFETLTPREKYIFDDDHCTMEGHAVMVDNIAQKIMTMQKVEP